MVQAYNVTASNIAIRLTGLPTHSALLGSRRMRGAGGMLDAEGCWRWAYKKSFKRVPTPEQLDRYRYWHRINRMRGDAASGPWETWPHRPIPDGEAPPVWPVLATTPIKAAETAVDAVEDACSTANRHRPRPSVPIRDRCPRSAARI